jgi:hypothetical protein
MPAALLASSFDLSAVDFHGQHPYLTRIVVCPSTNCTGYFPEKL